jgi:hypothetical protein
MPNSASASAAARAPHETGQPCSLHGCDKPAWSNHLRCCSEACRDALRAAGGLAAQRRAVAREEKAQRENDRAFETETNFSLTITKNNTDIEVAKLSRIRQFFLGHTTVAMAALERGDKCAQLHIQAWFTARGPGDTAHLQELDGYVSQALFGCLRPMGYKINLKRFGPGQTIT